MAFQVEFVSPEDLLYSGQASQVVARTRGGGEIAFLEGHESFVGSLVTCEVRVSEEAGDVARFAVRGGFVSVAGGKVTVLSEAAKSADEIDTEVAQADLESAQKSLETNPEDSYAKADELWAQVRIDVANGDVTASH